MLRTDEFGLATVALETIDFEDRVKEIEVQSPGELVQSVLCSLSEAVALLGLDINSPLLSYDRKKRYSFWNKLYAIAKKIVSFEGGEVHAFELFFRIRIDSLLGDARTTSLDRRLMNPLCGLPVVRDASARPVPDLDFAATSRTLRRSMRERGCVRRDLQHRNLLSIDDRCACYRANSLELLQELQTKAWSQIKAKVLLTVGTLVPKELCDAILEFAL